MSAVDVLALRGAEILSEKHSDGTRIGRELLAIRIARFEQRVAEMTELVEALPDPRTLRKCLEAGASEYLTKWRESLEGDGPERVDFYTKATQLQDFAERAEAALARCKGEAK